MQDQLRRLPAVHVLASAAAAVADGDAPAWALAMAARAAIAGARAAIVDGRAPVWPDPLAVARAAAALRKPSLRRVINGTGVVLHTNLGRAVLADAAIAAVVDVAGGACNLEYDLAAGGRGSRHAHVAALAASLCGAEAALVVNNNAAATVLALAALAGDRDVIVSRGELVEIGGAFRVPEILALSRCRLVEVGTTNKTRLADYERAITSTTALLLKVHRSNFAMIGFTEEVDAAQLTELAHARGLASMVDLGSGVLVPTPTQRAWGLPSEPTVAEVVASRSDLVCFSGDKLLGGPQAGIVVGSAASIARMRAHPLLRALRPDKLTLAALEATLALYRDGAWADVPALATLSTTPAVLHARAEKLAQLINGRTPQLAAVVACVSTVGGGSMPTAALPSFAVALAGQAEHHDLRLRAAQLPVIGRIANGLLHLDLRTITDDELALVATACAP